MADPSTLVIGTRGSPLALAQAHETQARLGAVLGLESARLPLDVIKTSGDAIQDRALSEVGGKGLWTKELDAALLDGTVDLAVHSAKDLPTLIPAGLVIAGYLPREDVRDAFVSLKAQDLHGLPEGAVVGSASLRRQAQVRRLRPDLRVELMRGNVETRLRKLEAGAADATLLALAGLKRLGLDHRATAILDEDSFLPAVGQGAIALVTRADDGRALEAVGALTDAATGVALLAERAYLAVLDGSCRTPIAGHATTADGKVRFRGLVLRPDGSESLETAGEGDADAAEEVGRAAGHDLRARMPPGMLSA